MGIVDAPQRAWARGPVGSQSAEWLPCSAWKRRSNQSPIGSLRRTVMATLATKRGQYLCQNTYGRGEGRGIRATEAIRQSSTGHGGPFMLYNKRPQGRALRPTY